MTLCIAFFWSKPSQLYEAEILSICIFHFFSANTKKILTNKFLFVLYKYYLTFISLKNLFGSFLYPRNFVKF